MSSNGLAPGTVLDGKWRVDGLIGAGGMGSVYAATHLRNGARVALKVLHPEVSRNAVARERFLREGYAANRVGHPGVVNVLDDGTTQDGLVFLVMERLEGKSLDVIVDEAGGALSLDATMRFAIPWLEVIAAAHSAGVVHRDLKPENVFACSTGVVKVLDFGLARVHEGYREKRLTTTGLMFGTPAFMPPEQALARWDEVDARSDVYAMGASIFTMLTGQLVHSGETVPEILVAVSTRPARPLRSVMPALPPGIAAVIDTSLQFRRQDRFADGGAMLVALRSAVAGHVADLPDRERTGDPRSVSFEEAPTVQARMTPKQAQDRGVAVVRVAPNPAERTLAMAPMHPPAVATVVAGTLRPTLGMPVSPAAEGGRRRGTSLLLGALAGIGVLGVCVLSIVHLLARDPTTLGAAAGEVPATVPSAPSAASGGTSASSVVSSSPGPTAAAASADTAPQASGVAAAGTVVSTVRPPSPGAKPPSPAGVSAKNCHFDELRQIRVCK